MAGRKDNNLKQNTASLLLQPPNSGFSWDQMLAGSNVLMPVSPPSAKAAVEDGAEPDSFVGQQQPPTQIFSQAPLQAAIPQNPPSTAFSQLRQPLRPVQSRSPVPVETPGSVARPQLGPGMFPPPPPSAMTSGPPSVSAPPTGGPVQNFRRQAPFNYAPPPGTTGLPTSDVPVMQPGPSFQPLPTQEFPPQSLPQNYAAYETAQQPSTSQQQHPIAPPPTAADIIKPVQPHWFYRKEVEKKEVWYPFTVLDSLNLEEAYKSNPNAVVTTDGGRYDIHLAERIRRSVYWEEEPMPVKRASWFYKAEGQNRFTPYDEDVAELIEAHYKDVVLHGRWHHKLELPGGETIVVHSSVAILHFMPSSQPDEWGNVVDGQVRPRVVKRGTSEVTTIDHGESLKIDHVVFFVHGVGAVCDLKFRSVFECVDDFRSIALGLLQSHFRGSIDEGRIGRIEFLPVSWHWNLHGDATGIDRHMQMITLPSIPKLRYFTNDTLLDILFYTSPVYCQTIVDTVATEVNRMYDLFLTRNPDFRGKASVAGHSLGSLILFDILAHQRHPNRAPSPATVMRDPSPPPPEVPEAEAAFEGKNGATEETLEDIFQSLGLEEYVTKFKEEKIDFDTLKFCSESDIKEMGLPMGPRKKLLVYLKEREEQQQKLKAEMEQKTVTTSPQESVSEAQTPSMLLQRSESVASVTYRVGMAGTGQPSVVYPKLGFNPSCFFALGSPIAMFLTVRGIETIGEEFHLPTCPAFFNIFHPFDPVAYRMETLIDPQLDIKPVLIPHHKGRKRMHLELRDSLTRMGTDLKQKLIDSLRYTWNSISEFARAHRSSTDMVEEAMEQMVQDELTRSNMDTDDAESTVSDTFAPEEIQIGRLNGGRRVDYVLQEKPIESFNEYLFALASHMCYWESEDTALMILKEVYAVDGIYPQQPSAIKVQLYNPAIPKSSIPPPPSYSMQARTHPNGLGSVPTTPAPFEVPGGFGPSTVPPPPTQPLGPPPLTGFVRGATVLKR